MCSGRSLDLLLIFPFGMWSLSAIRVAFVSILLAVCTFTAGFVCDRMLSISSENFVQLAFL